LLHQLRDTFRLRYLRRESICPHDGAVIRTDWPDGKTPDEIVVEAAGHRIFLTHGHIYGVRSTLEMLVAAAKEAQADIAVYGHTHVAQEVAGDVHVLNPGSVARPRDEARPSFMLAELEVGKSPQVELIRMGRT